MLYLAMVFLIIMKRLIFLYYIVNLIVSRKINKIELLDIFYVLLLIFLFYYFWLILTNYYKAISFKN